MREARERRHVVHLGGRVALEVHVRQLGLQGAERVEIEVEVDVRVLAVDHVDLGERGQPVLLDRVADELLGRRRVGVLLLLGRRERAELAFHAADVRLAEVEVLDERHLVGAAAEPSREVGQLADLEQVVGFEDREAVLELEALAGLDLLANRAERGCAVEECHAAWSPIGCGRRRRLRGLRAPAGATRR